MGRFAAACRAFRQVLTDPDRAAAWERLAAGTQEEADQQVEDGVPGPQPEFASDAVYTLVLLQREGRFIDFLLEDVDQYEDAQIGAAVRQIHAGCRRVLDEHFGVKPVRDEGEGGRVEVPADFDPSHVRLTGDVSGEPPFSGTLRHRGWRATDVKLPERHAQLDPAVICPAEVEV